MEISIKQTLSEIFAFEVSSKIGKAAYLSALDKASSIYFV